MSRKFEVVLIIIKIEHRTEFSSSTRYPIMPRISIFFLIFPFLKLLLFHDQVDSFTIGVVGCTRVGQLLSSERHKNEKYSITIRCRDSLLRSISKKDSAVSIPEEQPKDFVLNAGEEKKILDTSSKKYL